MGGQQRSESTFTGRHRSLAALLDTVVFSDSGQPVEPESPVAMLGDTGPVDFVESGLRPDESQAYFSLIAGVAHAIIPTRAAGDVGRLIVLVPPSAWDRSADGHRVSAEWADRLRVVEATMLMLTPQQAPEAPLDGRALHLELSLARDEAIRRYSSSLDRAVELFVRRGDGEHFRAHLAARPLEDDVVNLTDGDRLRGMKDLAISILAVATRIATSAGMNVPAAFAIGDHFIRRTERCIDIEATKETLTAALTALADGVASAKLLGRSAIVRSAEELIYLRLDQDLRSSVIAAALGVTADYLADRFRRETGLRIAAYVRIRRVEEAKTLLAHTDLSLLDVCVRLGFYDQSHFTRVFREVSGSTPKAYKLSHASRFDDATIS